jgi:RsmE family RNA methyltransferase
MNLVLLFDDDFVGETRVRIDGRRWRHVVEVVRAGVGDHLRVGRLAGATGTGTIVQLEREALLMDVRLDRPPPAPLPLTLLLALPRPKSLRRVLQAVTALGVKDLVLMATWRVEKSFWDSPALAPDAVHEQLRLGLEQAGDTMPPRLELRRRFKPFIEDEVPELIRGTRALVAHPRDAQPCPRGLTQQVTLAVGPEGGFTPYEIDAFRARGFEVVSLGERPLRVEHAVPALIGRIF